jgi:hypothetical protein
MPTKNRSRLAVPASIAPLVVPLEGRQSLATSSQRAAPTLRHGPLGKPEISSLHGGNDSALPVTGIPPLSPEGVPP